MSIFNQSTSSTGDPNYWLQQAQSQTWTVPQGASTINISTWGGGGAGGAIAGSLNPIYIEPGAPTELRSSKLPTSEHAHDIQCILRLETYKVVAEYTCSHCNEVLFRKVICKLPKSIIKQKCLARIVKGV